MRRILRILAAALAVLAVIAWAVGGANAGWTKTTRTRTEKDPVTDISYPVVEKRFAPGVDLLAGAFFVAALLAVGSFLVTPKKP